MMRPGPDTLPTPEVTAVQNLDAVQGLDAGPAGQVVEVVDGDTVILDNGLEVRLVGIQAPKLPLGRPNFEAWPLADKAKTGLEDLVLGRQVSLQFGGRQTDRYERALAHLVRDDGLWIQGQLLSDGLARVYPFADNRALIDDMLILERQARDANVGLWANDFYRILDHNDAAGGLDGYALVEGRVTNAAVVRGRGFLNFGEDYRTDFTISIDPEFFDDNFEAAGIDLDRYVGARVRVRGWLRKINGVSVDVTHPQQIEILQPSSAR